MGNILSTERGMAWRYSQILCFKAPNLSLLFVPDHWEVNLSPFSTLCFTEDLGCCVLFGNNHTSRSIMDKCCVLCSIPDNTYLQPILWQSWGVDIALEQDRKGILLYLLCDSKLLMFSFAGRNGGKCISISIAAFQVSGSVLIFSRGNTISGNAAVIGFTA